MANLSSIHTLTELCTRQSEEAVVRLGQANQNHHNALEKLQILKDYHHNYAERLQDDMANGLNMNHYNNFVGFLSNLEKAVAQQEREVSLSLYVLEQQRNEWQQYERKRLSFDTLKSRAVKKQQNIENRREQKLNDEFAERSKRIIL